jgi:hypothetical protein
MHETPCFITLLPPILLLKVFRTQSPCSSRITQMSVSFCDAHAKPQATFLGHLVRTSRPLVTAQFRQRFFSVTISQDAFIPAVTFRDCLSRCFGHFLTFYEGHRSLPMDALRARHTNITPLFGVSIFRK